MPPCNFHMLHLFFVKKKGLPGMEFSRLFTSKGEQKRAYFCANLHTECGEDCGDRNAVVGAPRVQVALWIAWDVSGNCQGHNEAGICDNWYSQVEGQHIAASVPLTAEKAKGCQVGLLQKDEMCPSGASV